MSPTAIISDSGRVLHGDMAKARSRKVVLMGEMERVEVLPLRLRHHYGRDKRMIRVEKLPRYPKQRVEMLPQPVPRLHLGKHDMKQLGNCCRRRGTRHFLVRTLDVQEASRT